MTIETFMTQWCAATGMAPWDPDSDLIVWLEGVPVALEFERAQDTHRLHVLTALGRPGDPAQHERLLQLNFDPGSPGCFGIEPESGDVCYRIDIALDDQVDARELPAYLGRAMAAARDLLVSPLP